ncbi:hypothetical protein NP233_g11288 [Leucocoprinus birnbaumii]|uniref:Uncharacterized protein n=1 Tax=Leucocoprinus birnbaumii TaxID=56174 RepID=A0AAD5VGU0_9AGAR|nr:hypothetical protein NP233_g11288 [Leucocoprinus birnbaumii]
MAYICICGYDRANNNTALTKHKKRCDKAILKKKQKRALQALKGPQITSSGGDLSPVQATKASSSQAPPNAEALEQPTMDIEMATVQEPHIAQAPAPSSAAESSRPIRQRKIPRRFQDMVPSTSTPIFQIHAAENQPSLPQPPQVHLETPEPIPTDPPLQLHETEPNSFGLYRLYAHLPSANPEDACDPDDLSDSHNHHKALASQSQRWWTGLGAALNSAKDSFYAPFLNVTVYRLMNWFYSGSTTKSLADLDQLVSTVLLADDYDPAHLKGFSASCEGKRLDEVAGMAEKGSKEGPAAKGKWRVSSVELPVPVEGKEFADESQAPRLKVDGIHHCSLVEIIKTAFSDESARGFHYMPFKLFRKSNTQAEPERIYSELYNSDAFLEEHAKLQKQPRKLNCTLETAVAAIMLWSDSTHLADFGNASLWPIYCYFGNQSKYERAKPTAFAAHHLAYISTLPSTFQDWYSKVSEGASAPDALFTHLKRDLIHAIWSLILDPDFLEAYVHGIVVECADGIMRRLFPRFFTYAADYPEKILLATIRFLGGCPCPRCTIKKEHIAELGTAADRQRRSQECSDNHQRRFDINRVRELIFEGWGVASAAANRILKPLSLVPTRNAFSEKLSKFGFDYHKMFVPDFLHEFELGVWKAVFTHLIRLLYASGDGAIQELNRRYRAIPTFGQSTIRRFSEDASAMKKLAGRDFEDLLQCAIPAFDGLLPAPHNDIVLDLLFSLCRWHALGKLRLHTTSTLQALDQATTNLGSVLRKFKNSTCSFFRTTEVPRNTAARGRQSAAVNNPGEAATGASTRLLNLLTYKLHALGDYVATIIRFGTTDSYSTQIGELEHWRIKNFYVRTNKRASFVRQITKHERRERLIQAIQQTPGTNPFRYVISYVPFPEVSSRTSNVAVQKPRRSITCIIRPKAQDHLLSRLNGMDAYSVQNFSDHDRNALQFSRNRIYQHKYLRLNYTTYDMRRGQDSVNPRTHPDIMLLDGSTDFSAVDQPLQPYLYARVLGIFHADVQWHRPQADGHQGPWEGPRVWSSSMDFLWVRWFSSSGVTARNRLPQVNLQATGLIQTLLGQTHQLGKSIAQRPEDKGADWLRHFVNIFVDRDMFMRYEGGGVGHCRVVDAATRTFPSQDSEPIDEAQAASHDNLINGPGAGGDDLELDGDDGDDAVDNPRLRTIIDDYGYCYQPGNDSHDKGFDEAEIENHDDQWVEDGEESGQVLRPEDDGYGAYD